MIRSKDKVHADQTVDIIATIANITQLEPQPIALNIVYEDQDIIILNKPAGIVTHPGAGNANNTLLNALLYHYPELAKLPRAGIIHRLDKDTSGIMVVARNLMVHNKLVVALQQRKIKREYEAIVNGEMIAGGTIKAAIGRHPTKRTHMAVKENGKAAVTHYRVIKRFTGYTHIQVTLETGRTHQIRVHMAHIGYPIVGDPTYSNVHKISEKLDPTLREKLRQFGRQALHARRLELQHPSTDKLMSWEVKPPKDFEELLKSLCLCDAKI
ncbi:MAG TPA: 23S rRNA pseudouridine(1911/1915/1917) synthase RluD [Coxiellaceae bacterium]|nr:23S rRNA pseudouridine(1911/1915/1917) synthase RluD [Coxiellaceae bacterium]